MYQAGASPALIQEEGALSPSCEPRGQCSEPSRCVSSAKDESLRLSLPAVPQSLHPLPIALMLTRDMPTDFHKERRWTHECQFTVMTVVGRICHSG